MSEELLGIIPIRSEGGAFDRFKMEKLLFEKFGKEGYQAYILVDGKMTGEELRSELKVPEKKMMDILDFMEANKIVSLKTVFELEYEASKKKNKEE